MTKHTGGPASGLGINHDKNCLADLQGRVINYMRISITDRCNFRCQYCMPPEGVKQIPHDALLSFEEILRFCKISATLGVSRYKITGGEPLCRKGAVSFIERLKQTPGVEQVTLTTNASLLGPAVEQLAEAGLDGINVSLDSLNQEHFSGITRSSVPLETVLSAMQKAKDRGIPVKINAVPMVSRNDEDIVALTRFALENDYHIRFIELMPVGKTAAFTGIAEDSLKDTLVTAFGPLTPDGAVVGNGPAAYYTVDGFHKKIGFISAVSHKFCASCNRVRLTSEGYLKTCLYHNHGTAMKPLLRGEYDDASIAGAIAQSIADKPVEHFFSSSHIAGAHTRHTSEVGSGASSIGGLTSGETAENTVGIEGQGASVTAESHTPSERPAGADGERSADSKDDFYMSSVGG